MGNTPDLMKTTSRIFFGTANPPISTDDKTAYDLLDSVLESGINAFDCARSYGKAEQVLAVKYGVSVPEIAMRYIFSNEINIFAVVSTTSAERLKMNIHAANNPLNAEDVAYLEA